MIRRATDGVDRGDAPNVKTGRRKRLHPLTLRGGKGSDHLLKVKEYRFLPGVLRMLRRGSARREVDLSFALSRRGMPVALPLAVGEERRWGRLLSGYLLSPILDVVVDLRRLMADPDLRPGERRAIVTAFATFSRQVHDAGFDQDDFAPNNFLVRRGDPPSFILIDFERARLVRRLSRFRRLWMLAKLDRHVIRCRTAERMRFLRAYTGGNREEAKDLWQETARLAPSLAWHDFRRLRRICAAENRRFRRVREYGYVGWAVRDVAIPRDLSPQEKGGASGTPRIFAAGQAWILGYGPLSVCAGQKVWTLANALWARGALVPRPLFLLRRAGSVVLGLAREPSDRLLSGAGKSEAVGGALTVLLEQLVTVGELDPALGRDDIVLVAAPDGVLRAALLAPHRFSFRRSAVPDPHSRARALARTLLSGIAAPVCVGSHPDPGIQAPAGDDRQV